MPVRGGAARGTRVAAVRGVGTTTVPVRTEQANTLNAIIVHRASVARIWLQALVGHTPGRFGALEQDRKHIGEPDRARGATSTLSRNRSAVRRLTP